MLDHAMLETTWSQAGTLQGWEADLAMFLAGLPLSHIGAAIYILVLPLSLEFVPCNIMKCNLSQQATTAHA